MILITTAGNVGAAAAQALAAGGQPVRVMVRHPDKASDLAKVGVEVVTGDLTISETIDAAMRGVTSVVLVSHAIPPQELGVIQSARRAGVRHIVKITSDASADSPIMRRRNQAAIETGLVASGIGHTLLRNNGYMQNFLMFAPLIGATDSFSMATGDGKVAHVDARDVGAVAAEIASSPDAHVGKVYWPTGPESLSNADVAEVLSQVLGRSITFNSISFDEQREALVKVGMPEPIAEDTAKAINAMKIGEGDYVTDDVKAILGRSPRNFREFATDFAAAFAAPVGAGMSYS